MRIIGRGYFLIAIALAVSGCVTAYGMSAREVANSWVGRDISELRSQWNINWFGGNSPNQDGEYVHSANFGQNAGYETTDNSYVRATGPDTYEQVEESDTVYRERSVECVIEFYADSENRRIVRVTVDGECDGYARSWGAAPGYRPGAAPAGQPGDTVIRRL